MDEQKTEWIVDDMTREEPEEVTYHAGPSWGVFRRTGPDSWYSVASEIDTIEDARLIYAAPDLLKACRGLLVLAEFYSPERGAENAAITAAKAAIAKATT